MTEEPPINKYELNICFKDVEYKSVLELFNEKIKIRLRMEPLTPYEWQQEFSLEDLQLLHSVFKACKNLENAFEGLKNMFNNNVTISHIDETIVLTLHLEFFMKCQFDIILPQNEINLSETFQSFNQQNSKLQRENANESSKKKRLYHRILSSKVFMFCCHILVLFVLFSIQNRVAQDFTVLKNQIEVNQQQVRSSMKENERKILDFQHSLYQNSTIKQPNHKKQSSILLDDDIPFIESLYNQKNGDTKLSFELQYQQISFGKFLNEIEEYFDSILNMKPKIILLKLNQTRLGYLDIPHAGEYTAFSLTEKKHHKCANLTNCNVWQQITKKEDVKKIEVLYIIKN